MATKQRNHVLVITGGHDFQPEPFWGMFDSLDNLSYEAATFPDAFGHLTVEGAKGYDALVFYDMWQEITPAQQAAYVNLLTHGVGIVSLHHALISFREWDEFNRIVGGVWNSDVCTVRHDVQFTVRIADPNHPVTSGIDDFEIQDETYRGYAVNPNVHVLLRTDHRDSASVIGWTHSYANSPIVYIQHGHDAFAYRNPNYRKLIRQAIRWVVEASGAAR